RNLIRVVPSIQCFDRIKYAFANFYIRRTDARSAPVPKCCDRSTVALSYFFVSKIARISSLHGCPPRPMPSLEASNRPLEFARILQEFRRHAIHLSEQEALCTTFVVEQDPKSAR